MESLLREWGLENYISKFHDEGINNESFELLDDETINVLFDKAGPKLIFKAKYNAYELSKSMPVESSQATYELEYLDSPSLDTSGTHTEYCFEPDKELSDILNENSEPVPKQQKLLSYEAKCPASTSTEFRLSETLFYKSDGLMNLLKNSAEGRILLKQREKLNNPLRTSLVRIIINELMTNYDNIKTTQFQKIVDEILTIFPRESGETYYIPHSRPNKNTRFSARGKLVSKYHNIRAALRSLNPENKKLENKETEKPLETTSDCSEKLNYLKTALEPFPKILQFWEETLQFRKKKYRTASIDEIFQAFPCLTLKNGYELLESDFDQLYPDKKEVIYRTFSTVVEGIIKEVQERHIHLDVIGPILNLQGILALPSLFSPITLRKTNKDKNIWRPSRIEVQESFFFHIENQSLLREVVQRRLERLSKFDAVLQPFALAVGPLFDVEFYLVYVDEKITYKFNSAVRTLEVLYKIFHALDLEYALESKHVWLMVQEVIFEMKATSKSSSSATVIADIKYQINALKEL